MTPPPELADALESSARDRPDVATVILSFNGADTLPEVIAASGAQTIRTGRTIAVDNGSWDGSVSYLSGLGGQVEPILLDHNTGVGAGHNRGWRAALDDRAVRFVWALEHDTVPHTDCLERLLETYAFLSGRGLRVGAVWPVQVLPGSGRDPQPPGTADPPERAWDNGAPHLTTKLHLNGPLLSVEALRDVGLLREDFVVGQEDRELGLRLCHAGYAVVRDPFAIVAHRNKGKLRRGGRHSTARVYYGTRNGVYLLRGRGRDGAVLAKVLAHALGGALRTIVSEEDKADRLRARLLGTRDGWRGSLGPASYRFLDASGESRGASPIGPAR